MKYQRFLAMLLAAVLSASLFSVIANAAEAENEGTAIHEMPVPEEDSEEVFSEISCIEDTLEEISNPGEDETYTETEEASLSTADTDSNSTCEGGEHTLPEGVKYHAYEDTDDDGVNDAYKDYSSYDDIPCGATFAELTYTCAVCGEEVNDARGLEPKPHEFSESYELDGTAVEFEAIPCEREYTEVRTCSRCGAVERNVLWSEHKANDDGMLYATVTLAEDGDSYELTGTYDADYAKIPCESWYVEKFTCGNCGQEIINGPSYKNHEPNGDGILYASVEVDEDEDGNIIYTLTGDYSDDFSLIPCESWYIGKITCTCGAEIVDKEPSYKEHEPNDEGVFYALVEAAEDEDGNVSYTQTGDYSGDFSLIPCESWYMEKFSCSCGTEIISKDPLFKNHEPDDNGTYYASVQVSESEDGTMSYTLVGEYSDDFSLIPCESWYITKFTCTCGKEIIGTDPVHKEHEPSDGDILYATATVTEDEDGNRSYELTGEYTSDFSQIPCASWYVEQFTCENCGVVAEAIFKDHIWEEKDGETICSVCGEVKKAYLPGDINNDEKVNNKDVTRLMRYIKYKDVEVATDALDVNGDGSINNKDVTRLMRYVKYKDVDIY